jgi:hypothetical protein
MDLSFLIPVRIDSQDRLNNFRRCLQYLVNYAPYNIIILEDSDNPVLPNIIKNINLNGASVDYNFSYNPNELFHKTKLLNILSQKAKTSVIVNYDTDILLNPEAYKFCYNLIVNDNYDLIYPFGKGEFLLNVRNNSDIGYCDWSDVKECDLELKICNHGLCQFLNRHQYIKNGGMNENFVSYGPEDWELGYRFKKLELKISWINSYIVHFDHFRGTNSSQSHPRVIENYALFDKIKGMNLDNLKKYYNIK